MLCGIHLKKIKTDTFNKSAFANGKLIVTI